MSIVRRLTAIVAIAAGAVAFHAFCLLPYRCNRIKNAYVPLTASAYDRAGTPEGSLQARRNLTVLQQCMTPACGDISLYMIAAANYQVLGRYDEAIRLYREALRLGRRPELYVNLGAAEAAAGDRTAARNDMLRAAMFNPWSVQGIDDGKLRQEVVQQLIARRPENADYIRYVDTVQLP